MEAAARPVAGAAAVKTGRPGVRVQVVRVLGKSHALLAVASHCTVHNTLRQPPEVSIELARTR